MSREPGGDGPKSPLHHRFESCSAVVSLERDEPLGAEGMKDLARNLMGAVTEKVMEAGALDVGHVKAVLESGGCFLYANTVGDPQDVTVRSNEGASSREIKLTLNIVALGLEAEKIRNAADEALEMVAAERRLMIMKPGKEI